MISPKRISESRSTGSSIRSVIYLENPQITRSIIPIRLVTAIGMPNRVRHHRPNVNNQRQEMGVQASRFRTAGGALCVTVIATPTTEDAQWFGAAALFCQD